MPAGKSVTIKAPVNIAVIKYCKCFILKSDSILILLFHHFKKGGKSNEKLILALNDSISGTLSINQLSACTTVMVSEKFSGDRFWLNGKEQKIETSKRLSRCLEESKF